jgi:hypothetical protein
MPSLIYIKVTLDWTKLHKNSKHHGLPPTNLPRRHRLNPAHRNIDPNDDRTNNPNARPITRPIPKNNRKHNPPKIPARARESRHHTIRLGMHVRHKRKRQSVRARQEKRETHCYERHHGADALGIHEPDDEQHGAGADAVDMQKGFLRPHGVRVVVCNVADDAAQRPPDDVHETEHRGPVACLLGVEGGELLGVVGAENAVDGELGAEGAEVGGAGDDCLGREAYEENVFEGGLLDDFAAGCVEDLLFADLGFGVAEFVGGVGGFLFVVVQVGVSAGLGVGRVHAVGGCVGVFGVFTDLAGDVDDGGFDGGVVVRGHLHAFRPLSGGRIGTEQDEEGCYTYDQDSWDDEGDSPSDVGGEPLLGHERVVDGRHGEVGDASSGIAEAGGDGVCCADYVLVEEASRPYLAWYKATAKDTDEES